MIINKDYMQVMRRGRLLTGNEPVYLKRHEKDCWKAIKDFMFLVLMFGAISIVVYLIKGM